MKFIGIGFHNFQQLGECAIFKDKQTPYSFNGFGDSSELVVQDPLTDEELREIVVTGLTVPVVTLWLEITKEVAEGKCPADLGDGRKSFNSEYYVQCVEDRYFYIVGRANERGNYEGPLSVEVFNDHINMFGSVLYQHIPVTVEL